MQILMIRHGQTPGNLEKRYIGSTDEPLCPQTCQLLEPYFQQRKKEPVMENLHLYVSPWKRCIQTADYLFPGYRQQLVPDFRECDFGLWEGKNYRELAEDIQYQNWIDSGGTLPFPGGESREMFTKRCCDAFLEIMEKESKSESPSRTEKKLCFVVHGGTIMALGERFSMSGKGYYDYQAEPLCGYWFVWDEERRVFTGEKEWKLGDTWIV